MRKKLIISSTMLLAACGNPLASSVYDEPAPDPNDMQAVRALTKRVVAENAGMPAAAWEGHLLGLWASRERMGGSEDPSPGHTPATVGEAIYEERKIQEQAMGEILADLEKSKR